MDEKEELRQRFIGYLNGLTEEEFDRFSGDFLEWMSSLAQSFDVPEFVVAFREHLPEFQDFAVSWDVVYPLILLFAKENRITAEEVVDTIFEEKDSGILLGPLQGLCSKDPRLAAGVSYSVQLTLIHLNTPPDKIFSCENTN